MPSFTPLDIAFVYAKCAEKGIKSPGNFQNALQLLFPGKILTITTPVKDGKTLDAYQERISKLTKKVIDPKNNANLYKVMVNQQEQLRGWEVQGLNEEELASIVPTTIPTIQPNQLFAIGVDAKVLDHKSITHKLQEFAFNNSIELKKNHTLAVADDGTVFFVSSLELTNKLFKILPTTEPLSEQQAQAIVNAAANNGPFFVKDQLNAALINQSLKRLQFPGFVEERPGQDPKWQLTTTTPVRETLKKYSDSLLIPSIVVPALGVNELKNTDSVRLAINSFCKRNQLTELPLNCAIRIISPDGDVCIVTDTKILPLINDKLPKEARPLSAAEVAGLFFAEKQKSAGQGQGGTNLEFKNHTPVKSAKELTDILKKLGIPAGVELKNGTFSLYTTDDAWEKVKAAYAPFVINLKPEDFESFSAEIQAKNKNLEVKSTDRNEVLAQFLGQNNSFLLYEEPLQVLVKDLKSARKIQEAQQKDYLLPITQALLSIIVMTHQNDSYDTIRGYIDTLIRLTTQEEEGSEIKFGNFSHGNGANVSSYLPIPQQYRFSVPKAIDKLITQHCLTLTPQIEADLLFHTKKPDLKSALTVFCGADIKTCLRTYTKKPQGESTTVITLPMGDIQSIRSIGRHQIELNAVYKAAIKLHTQKSDFQAACDDLKIPAESQKSGFSSVLKSESNAMSVSQPSLERLNQIAEQYVVINAKLSKFVNIPENKKLALDDSNVVVDAKFLRTEYYKAIQTAGVKSDYTGSVLQTPHIVIDPRFEEAQRCDAKEVELVAELVKKATGKDAIIMPLKNGEQMMRALKKEAEFVKLEYGTINPLQLPTKPAAMSGSQHNNFKGFVVTSSSSSSTSSSTPIYPSRLQQS